MYPRVICAPLTNQPCGWRKTRAPTNAAKAAFVSGGVARKQTDKVSKLEGGGRGWPRQKGREKRIRRGGDFLLFLLLLLPLLPLLFPLGGEEGGQVSRTERGPEGFFFPFEDGKKIYGEPLPFRPPALIQISCCGISSSYSLSSLFWKGIKGLSRLSRFLLVIVVHFVSSRNGRKCQGLEDVV